MITADKNMNSDLIDRVQVLRKLFQKNAKKIDLTAEFPSENLLALKESGFMGLNVPTQYGGFGLGINEVAEVSKLFANDCLSTAIIWGMHCQQVATIVDNANESFKNEFLPKIITGAKYIGSVTTEENTGGHLFKLVSSISRVTNESFYLDRFAPICTGGKYCDAYLITMKKSEEQKETEVLMIYADKEMLDIEEVHKPNLMGMRGTHSVSLNLKGVLAQRNILNIKSDFKILALRTLIPYGHLIWAASWLGALQGVFDRTIKEIFRNPVNRKCFNLKSEIFLEKTARVKLAIQIVENFLESCLNEYVTSVNKQDFDNLYGPAFQIKINNLKIVSSEQLFAAVHSLIDIVGLKFGYSTDPEVPIERVFRDLRAASLMYNNNRLLTANGALTILGASNFTFA